MTKYITVRLNKRNVTATIRLLEDEAPLTTKAVWNSLPRTGQAYHGKYARNEIYAFVEPLVSAPPLENSTITPFTGDVCYFNFSHTALDNPGYGYAEQTQTVSTSDVVDLAIFYGRNNLLINADQGWVPGTVFGHVEEGLQDLISAGTDIWQRGFLDESFTFARLE